VIIERKIPAKRTYKAIWNGFLIYPDFHSTEHTTGTVNPSYFIHIFSFGPGLTP
jgi:hypothetical protein